MKNFRKVLALVLVVATLFSFTAMTSAAKYEDADKISYNEAVTVLTHVGVLNGYEVAEDEFEFHPTDKITREEMAKMIAVMANAGTDVSELYASACTFADVAKDRWSASYVAYCAKTGIIAGRSATTFDPKANITGLETAKMLLVVLGFEADKQGYVGADWKVNVMRDAKTMGLLSNFAAGYDPEAAITREEAAQMMLNALEGNVVVGYLSDAAKVVVTNKAYNSWNDLKWTLVDAKGAAKLYGKVVISDDTLGNALFGLTRTTSATADCYGRPGTAWTYTKPNGTPGTIATAADGAIFSSNNTTSSKVKTALAAYTGTNTKVVFDAYWNGSKVASDATLANALAALEAKSPIGKGTVIEAYVTADNKEDGNSAAAEYKQVTLVQVDTFISKIESVNTAKGTFKFYGSSYNWKNEFGFTPANVGDVILAWYCAEAKDDCLHNAVLAEPTTVTVKTATVTDAHEFKYASITTTEGEKYEYAANFGDWLVVDDSHIIGANNDAEKDIGDSLDLYLDEHGFIMGFTKTLDTVTNVAVVEYGSLYEGPTYQVNGQPVKDCNVDMLAFDEAVTETEDVAISSASTDKVNTPAAGETRREYKNGTLVSYTTVSGKAVLTRATHVRNVQLTSGKAALPGVGVAVTNETQWIIRTFNYTTGEFEYEYVVGKDLGMDYHADLLAYIPDVSGKFAAYVYAEATYAAEANTAFILAKAYDEITITDGNVKHSYTGYTALVGGEKAIVAATERTLNSDYLYTSEYVYVGLNTADGLPIYRSMSANDPAKVYGTLSYSAGTLVDKNGTALDIADDALLVAAFIGDAWDHDADGVVDYIDYEICTVAEIGEYCSATGWSRPLCWVVTDPVTKQVVEMYLQLAPKTTGDLGEAN